MAKMAEDHKERMTSWRIAAQILPGERSSTRCLVAMGWTLALRRRKKRP